MLEIKTTNRMEKAFDGLISRIDMAEERITNLKNMTIETSKMEKQRKRDWKKWNRISKNCETMPKGIIYMEISGGEERGKGTEEIFEAIMSENFSQIKVR